MRLTPYEYSCSYSKTLEQISCIAQDSLIATKWLMDSKKNNTEVAWLFMYALDSYTYGQLDNYITEEQVSAIFTKVNVL